jgi:hypothetical protein
MIYVTDDNRLYHILNSPPNDFYNRRHQTISHIKFTPE